MPGEGSVLSFEADDQDACAATVRRFFYENKSAKIIKVALATRELKPLGTREWHVVDGNIEVISRIITSFIMTQPHGSVTICARAD